MNPIRYRVNAWTGSACEGGLVSGESYEVFRLSGIAHHSINGLFINGVAQGAVTVDYYDLARQNRLLTDIPTLEYRGGMVNGLLEGAGRVTSYNTDGTTSTYEGIWSNGLLQKVSSGDTPSNLGSQAQNYVPLPGRRVAEIAGGGFRGAVGTTAVPSPTPDSGQELPAPARFQNVVQDNQYGIFKAAHPGSSYDAKNTNVVITQADADSAVIDDNISWSFISGKKFQTSLRFTLSYDNQGNIHSVNMDITEAGSPRFPAFKVTNVGKKEALSYFSDKLKSKNWKFSAEIVKIINDNTSLESSLPIILEIIANNY